MEKIETIFKGNLRCDEGTGCNECQASCQSACKTSCTVGNQPCGKDEKINVKQK